MGEIVRPVRGGGKRQLFNFSSRVKKSTDGTTPPSTSIFKQFKRASGGEKSHQHTISVSAISGKEDPSSQVPIHGDSDREMKESCEQTFVKPRNRTLDRYFFFSRKQQNNE